MVLLHAAGAALMPKAANGEHLSQAMPRAGSNVCKPTKSLEEDGERTGRRWRSLAESNRSLHRERVAS
jgi:hypothetical protein